MDGQGTRTRRDTRLLTRAEAVGFHGERGARRRTEERAREAQARQAHYPRRGRKAPHWTRTPRSSPRWDAREGRPEVGRETWTVTREVGGLTPAGMDGRGVRDLTQARRRGARGARTRAQAGRRRGEPTGDPEVAPEIPTWKEAVVRVGTGYRVRKDERNPQKRRFDVGYADRKTYTRQPGREARIEASNMGRTVRGKGPQARVRVMNAVCAREKRRPASEYTGSGIRRKSKVGKRKLKPTKAQTKA